MSQTLTLNDSPARCARASRRHRRLAKRTGNDKALDIARRIDVPLAALSAAMAAQDAAEEVEEDALDDWIQDDRVLDGDVGRLDRKCVDWDVDHPTDHSRETVFKGATVSEVIRQRREDEVLIADQLVERATSLPNVHPAREVATRLAQSAEASRTAQAAHVTSIGAVARAKAAVDVAKGVLVLQYKDNAIDIRRACGDAILEACFPVLRSAPDAKPS